MTFRRFRGLAQLRSRESAAIATALAILGSVANGPTYSVVPLPPGTTRGLEAVVYGGSRNAMGQVVGHGAVAGGHWRGLVTGPDGGGPPVEIDPFPGEPAFSRVRAFGVSDDGRVVGHADVSGQARPFYWDGTS